MITFKQILKGGRFPVVHDETGSPYECIGTNLDSFGISAGVVPAAAYVVGKGWVDLHIFVQSYTLGKKRRP